MIWSPVINIPNADVVEENDKTNFYIWQMVDKIVLNSAECLKLGSTKNITLKQETGNLFMLPHFHTERRNLIIQFAEMSKYTCGTNPI